MALQLGLGLGLGLEITNWFGILVLFEYFRPSQFSPLSLSLFSFPFLFAIRIVIFPQTSIKFWQFSWWINYVINLMPARRLFPRIWRHRSLQHWIRLGHFLTNLAACLILTSHLSISVYPSIYLCICLCVCISMCWLMCWMIIFNSFCLPFAIHSPILPPSSLSLSKNSSPLV